MEGTGEAERMSVEPTDNTGGWKKLEVARERVKENKFDVVSNARKSDLTCRMLGRQ